MLELYLELGDETVLDTVRLLESRDAVLHLLDVTCHVDACRATCHRTAAAGAATQLRLKLLKLWESML